MSSPPPPTATAESLFHAFLAPHYAPGALADLATVRARDANPGGNPAIVAQVEALATTFAELAPRAFGDDALVLDRSDASVHRLAARLDRAVRDRWIATPTEAGGPPLLTTIVVHGALYVGACAVRNHTAAATGGRTDARWLVRSPLWESRVELVSPAGTAEIAPLAFWLKALADDEIDAPKLAERYRTHVEVPCFDAAALPAFLPADRGLPRLAPKQGTVRYDLLFKHLRAHAPELRDLGADFPTAERLAELELAWLEARVLGGGRLLLLAGPGRGGLHLFWLGAAGFEKALFVPADAFPEPRIDVLPATAAGEGLARPERVRAIVSVDGRPVAHETLWWGS